MFCDDKMLDVCRPQLQKQLIKNLYELCIKQPFDVEQIRAYICNHNIDRESITRVAIKLCEYVEFEYAEYIDRYNVEPRPEEMKSYNWDKLFEVLVESGLDANIVLKNADSTEDNILNSLRYIDNKDIGPRILKTILEKNGTPNVMISGMLFFADVDDDLIFDIGWQLYSDKWREELAFNFWLVNVGFGGKKFDGDCPVEMKAGHSVEELKEFYNYTYKVYRNENDVCISILSKENGEEVAVTSY